MARYAAVLGAVVASQGAAAVLHTRVVPQAQYPPANFDICHPQGTIVYGDTYPPCLSQGEIEGKCAPPTQDAAGWEFQRDCMCKGSFFEDAVGCIACKQCHAIQGQSESAHWDKVFGQIKADFCQKVTPTSNFGGYWSSALSAVGSPVPTPHDKRDRCVEAGNTVVEKYYVATKTQGPGLVRSTLTNAKAELHAAATTHYGVAVITGTPVAPGGPKFPLNATVANPDKAQVHYALASLPCNAALVNGSVQFACGPFALVANSSAMVNSESAKAGALNFGDCTCAVEYLAPQKQRPVSASSNGSKPAAVEIFSPKECTGPCHVPAPAAKVDDKTTPSQEKHATSVPGESGNKASGDKPSGGKPSDNKQSEDKPSGGKSSDKQSEDKPSGGKPSDNKQSEDKPSGGKPSDNKQSEDKPSGGKPSDNKQSEDKPSGGKPSDNKQSEDKPSGGKASEDKPSGGKASENKPSGGKPSKDTDIPEKAASGSSPAKGENKPDADCGEECPPAVSGTSKGGDAKVKPAPPASAGTGAPVSPAAGPAPVTAGAASTGASAAVLVVALAAYAL